MNILKRTIKKTKLINCFIKLGKIVQKKHKENPSIVKDALYFISSCIKEARPVVEEIKDILKND